MSIEMMGQRVRTYTALTEDLNSLPNTHVKWLTTTYDSSAKGQGTGLASVGSCTHLHNPHQNTHNFLKIKGFRIF